ncbi:MAG TPA: hypothetical protein PKW56_08955 [Clostridiales bacterium]|nr:hypothetical protein [Clostridiales bacterium]
MKKIIYNCEEDIIRIAAECGNFVQDDEDEIESDGISCVNCAYRRRGVDGIFCMREQK